jgi:hypothetical protein
LKVFIFVVLVLIALPTTGLLSLGRPQPIASTPVPHTWLAPNLLPAGNSDSWRLAADQSANGSLPGTAALQSLPGQAYGIWLVAYSGIMIRDIIHNLSSYLHPGDGVAIVLHNGGFAKLNSQAQAVHAALPNVTLRAYTSLDGGTGLAGGLATTIGKFSPLFSQLSGDYEVNGPVEFNANYSLALSYFSNFTSIVQSAGFQSIAYPSGRSVLGHQYGWNYGGFANLTDGQTIETQAYCGHQWRNATSKVWSQYNTTNVSLRTLSLQISLGDRCNTWQAIHAAKYWRQLTRGNVFFWWGPRDVKEMVTILNQVEH